MASGKGHGGGEAWRLLGTWLVAQGALGPPPPSQGGNWVDSHAICPGSGISCDCVT